MTAPTPRLDRAPAPSQVDGPSEVHEFRIPREMSLKILLWEFRETDITLDDIAGLNDDQVLDLKSRLDDLAPLFETGSAALFDDYKSAPKGSRSKRKKWELYFETHKMHRSFARLNEHVQRAAALVATRRGFSIPGSSFNPGAGETTAFEEWSGEIQAGLTESGACLFDKVRDEVALQLEFLLWEISYPEMGESYKRRYGFFDEGAVTTMLKGARTSRKGWSDFAPHLRDAAEEIASSFEANIERGSPAGMARFINGLADEVFMGLNEIRREAGGVIEHGIADADVADLYREVETMHGTPGSVIGCFEMQTPDAINRLLNSVFE